MQLLLLCFLVSSVRSQCPFCSFIMDDPEFEGLGQRVANRLKEQLEDEGFSVDSGSRASDDYIDLARKEDNKHPKSVSAIDQPNRRTVISNRPVSEIDSVDGFRNMATNLFSSLFGVLGHRANVISRGNQELPSGMDLGSLGSPRDETEFRDSIVNIFDTFGDTFGAIMTSQIKGPHVCIREVNTELPPSEVGVQLKKTCHNYKGAYKCVDRKVDETGGKQIARIHECCKGFETKDIVNEGCVNESSVRQLKDVVGEELKEFENKKDITLILSGKGGSPLVLPKAQRVWDWEDGDVLADKLVVKEKGLLNHITTYLNCVPLTQTNLRIPQGIAHIAQKSLNVAKESLLSLLQEDGRFSKFISLLSEDMQSRLSSNNETFTVFPFTDDTFGKLPQGIKDQIEHQKGCVKDIVLYHIVPATSFCSFQLEDLPHMLVNHRMLKVQKSLKGLSIGTAGLVDVDLVALNGVVHVVDDLLIMEDLLSWKDLLPKFHPQLSEELSKIFDDDKKITIFVPPNDNNTEITEPKNFVVSGKLLTKESLLATDHLTTDANSTFFVGKPMKKSPFALRIWTGPRKDVGYRIGCSAVMEKKTITTCNAIIHFLEKPLPMVETTVNELLAARGDLSLFHELLHKADLPSLPVSTYFVPSNDAFSKNQFRKLTEEKEISQLFVKRHVVDEILCPDDLSSSADLMRVEVHQNLAGENLRASNQDGNLVLENAYVQESIVLRDGIVHVLDSVINKEFRSVHPDSTRRHVTNLLNIVA